MFKCVVFYNTLDSVIIDNECKYENEIFPLTIVYMRSAHNMCSTRSGTFHGEISTKTRHAGNEFFKGKVYLSGLSLPYVYPISLGPGSTVAPGLRLVSNKHLNSSSKA